MIETFPMWAQITFWIIFILFTYFLSFIWGYRVATAFWKKLLNKALKENKELRQIKSLENKHNSTKPIVCGIDDRAVDCTDEICDRLMSPITKKHIEPVTYKYN